MKHLPLGILITLFALLGHCTPLHAQNTDTTSNVVECEPLALPFFEDFDTVVATSSSEEGYLPHCWDKNWNGSNAALAPHVISSDGYQYFRNLPNNALLMLAGSAEGYGNMAQVVLPHFDQPLHSLAISFDYRFEHHSFGALTVGYVGEDGMFVAVDSIEPNRGRYDRATVTFVHSTIPDSNAQIMLQWSYDSAFWYGVAIDNIEVFRDTTIYPPEGLTVDSVGYHCVGLSWQPVENATAYRLAIIIEHMSLIVDTTVTDLSFFFCGLDVNTSYKVILAAVVGGNPGRCAYVSFTTTCYEPALPYLEDFENVIPSPDGTHGFLPLCWNDITVRADVRHRPHVIGADGYSYISNLPDQALLMVTRATVSLPRLNQDLQNLSIALDYQFEDDTKGTLSVGYVDNNDTFVVIADMAPHAGSYRRDTILLNDLPISASHALLALRWICNVNVSYYGVAIDNLEVFAAHPDLQGIEETGSPKWNVEVFPNPASTDVTVRVSRPSTLTLLDLQGRMVIPSTTVNTQFPIRKSQLAPGTYFLRVTTDNSTLTKKLVIL